MEPPTVVVGALTKPHGVRGEVVVVNRSDNPDRWVPGAVVYLGDRALTVASVRERSAGRLLVAFEGIHDRAAAEALRGEVTVPQAWLPPLEEGQWWPSQLEGCVVTTDRGRELGQVADVIFNPANDLWVARDADGVETLIPVLADVVLEVDVDGRRILVRDIPGLTAPDA